MAQESQESESSSTLPLVEAKGSGLSASNTNPFGALGVTPRQGQPASPITPPPATLPAGQSEVPAQQG